MSSSPPSFAGTCLPSARGRRLPVRRLRRRGGFTLIESVLALGVVAVVFTSLCGVLPVAFSSYRDAMDATYRANVVKKITSELQQAPYNELAQAGAVRFFGDQGVEVDSRKEARFRVQTAPQGSATLFGENNSALKPVTINIYYAQAEGQDPISTITVFIADNGIRTQE